MQKILYHLEAGYKKWNDAGVYATPTIDNPKKQCIDHIHQTTGMPIDSPCGSGCTTNS